MDDLWDFHAGESETFNDFSEDLLDYVDEATADTNQEFCDAAIDELVVKYEYVEETTENWAYWLKYIYGYAGYE